MNLVQVTAAAAGNPGPLQDFTASSEAELLRYRTTQVDRRRLGDNDEIPVARLPRWDTSFERLERLADAEIRDALNSLGVGTFRRKLTPISPDTPAREDEARDEAHRQAGVRQAASSERVVMNGGRSRVWDLASRGRAVLGYIRVSLTGTPCDWCAMLISRGPVYSSAEKARFDEGDLYHDNCKCSV